MAKKKETKKTEEAVTGEVQQPKEEKKPNRLGDLISRIESRFGKEAIAGKKQDIEFVHSGSFLLDEILGGGLRRLFFRQDKHSFPSCYRNPKTRNGGRVS